MVDPSDVFIVDPAKIKFVPFRPFEKSEWGLGTPAPNGDDMWYQRTLGEYTLEVVDPGVAHAMIGYLDLVNRGIWGAGDWPPICLGKG